MSAVFPRLPTTSKISSFKVFPEDVWRNIIGMGNVDMGLLLKRKTKSSVKKETKSNTKKVAKTSKKRKAETKSNTEPTTKRRSKVTM